MTSKITTTELQDLRSRGFILGLLLLFLNDFVLKKLFYNYLTGKFSDFAGIFVFTIFWCALFPKKRLVVYFLITVFFIFWKFPHSEPLIVFINANTPLNYVRVVDSSDLLALLMIPLAYWYQIQLHTKNFVGVPIALSLSFASFLFIATSTEEELEDIILNENFLVLLNQEVLMGNLGGIDSLSVYPDNPMLKDTSSVYISYYSPNCDFEIGLTC